MYIRFNGNFEVFDDNNEMITKKKMDIIGSEFYSTKGYLILLNDWLPYLY